MSRFEELASFARVGERGSFRAAAADLGLSPSAVSKHVKALEERLGVRLVNRTTRRVSLTEPGRAFLARVGGILDELAEAEEAVGSLQDTLRGTLRIGAPMDFGRAHLAASLAAFAAAHPRLTLEVEFADRYVDVVEEGFDVVVRIGALEDSSLVARRIAPCRRVLCASPGYLRAHGEPEDPAALGDHVRIAYAYERERRWRFAGPEGEVRIAVPVRHRTNNGEMTRRLVLADQGLALMPTFLVADDLRAGRLVAVLRDALRADIAIQAVYPHRRHLSAKVRRVVDHLVEACGASPYWDEGLGLPEPAPMG
jgi:DNA-binding transcriptional LysR family regulator